MRCGNFLALVVALSFTVLTAATLQAQARFNTADVELSGLEPSEAALIAASGVLEPDHEIISRMAWRVRKIRHSQIIDGVRETVGSGTEPELEFSDDPKRFQFLPVTVRGRLVKLTRWTELDPVAQPPFWRLEMMTENGQTVMAVVSRVPEVWIDGSMPVEDVAVSGLAVGPVNWTGAVGGEPEDRGVVWLVAGQRASWFPKWTGDSDGAGLDVGIRLLTGSGFDAGWLDSIRQAGSKPLTVGERDAFESFVAAVARVGDQEWQQLESAGYPGTIVDLLQNAQRATGFPVSVEGQVRRVTSLPGGIQQVELFVETGTRGVIVTNAAGERLRFESRLPVTVNLPPESPDVSAMDGTRVRVDGFVYRFWTYQSAFAEEQGAASGQTVPLVIGWRMVRPDYGQQTFDRTLQYMLLGLVGFVCLMVVAVLRMNRKDQKDRDERRDMQRPDFG